MILYLLYHQTNDSFVQAEVERGEASLPERCDPAAQQPGLRRQALEDHEEVCFSVVMY